MVLAAGAGRRIGVPKALLRIEGRSFLAHVCARLARPGVAEVVAVLGCQAVRVRAEAAVPAPVRLLDHPHYASGMLSSVCLGLEAAERLGAQAVLVQPVDHPLVAEATLDRLVEALAGGARIAVPSHAGRRGHPTGFARDTWPALRGASAQRGAREVLARHPDWIVHVPGEAGCRAGIDTRSDYERLIGPWPGV